MVLGVETETIRKTEAILGISQSDVPMNHTIDQISLKA